MSKFAAFDGGDDSPPPYSPESSRLPTSPNYATPFDLESQSSLFAAHLSNLHSHILSEQASRTSARDQGDAQILALLVPHVELLLSSVASIDPAPTLVEGTIVPDSAIAGGWHVSHGEEGPQHQITRVIGVRRESKLDGDKKKPTTEKPTTEKPSGGGLPDLATDRGFDGWGRWTDDETASRDDDSDLWWCNEDMARRLAKHLEPDRPTASVDRQTVREHVAQTKKGQRWNMFAKKQPSPSPPTPAAASRTPRTADSSNVSMTVRAEEVSFRRENTFGIWENKSGWGIVVRVRIQYT